uniref:Uncharacterized protein n=1 Tax=Romanomermis culicivorax TaxID=13658 RepID=A0A915J1K5_ROMCU
MIIGCGGGNNNVRIDGDWRKLSELTGGNFGDGVRQRSRSDPLGDRIITAGILKHLTFAVDVTLLLHRGKNRRRGGAAETSQPKLSKSAEQCRLCCCRFGSGDSSAPKILRGVRRLIIEEGDESPTFAKSPAITVAVVAATKEFCRCFFTINWAIKLSS